MRKLLIFILLLLPGIGACQQFDVAGRKPVKLPDNLKNYLYSYIEKNGHAPLLHDQFAYVPVYNLLSRTQKQPVDGIYFYYWGSHDSGSLFILHKGTMTILQDDDVKAILSDYVKFIKNHKISEPIQLAYLSIISGFIKHKYDDQNMLENAGVLVPAK